MRYAVEFTKDPDGSTVLVDVPDLPSVHTFGDNENDARLQAVDAIETWLDHLIEDDEPLPNPSSVGNRTSVGLSVRTSGKIAVYTAMHDTGNTRGSLAHRLGWPVKRVIRLLDLFADTSIDDIEMALRALGYEASIDVRPAA